MNESLVREIEIIEGDLEYEQDAYEQAARAPYDGRLVNAAVWRAAQARRRRRIRELEAALAEARSQS